MKPALSGDALKHLRHDLRTPINHILGYTEILLEDSDGGSAEMSGSLREIHSGGRALLEMIQGGLGDANSSVSADQSSRAFAPKPNDFRRSPSGWPTSCAPRVRKRRPKTPTACGMRWCGSST